MNIVDDHTVELLRECSSGCHMAQDSVKQVRQYTKGEKLNELLEAYGEKHTGIEREIAQMLGEYGSTEKEPGMMAEMGAKMGTWMKMTMHPDDHEVAKLMMDGCNMGIQSVSEYVNKYQDANERAHTIAKQIIKVEEDFMKEMKGFV